MSIPTCRQCTSTFVKGWNYPLLLFKLCTQHLQKSFKCCKNKSLLIKTFMLLVFTTHRFFSLLVNWFVILWFFQRSSFSTIQYEVYKDHLFFNYIVKPLLMFTEASPLAFLPDVMDFPYAMWFLIIIRRIFLSWLFGALLIYY